MIPHHVIILWGFLAINLPVDITQRVYHFSRASLITAGVFRVFSDFSEMSQVIMIFLWSGGWPLGQKSW
jgi:hypothetical protein